MKEKVLTRKKKYFSYGLILVLMVFGFSTYAAPQEDTFISGDFCYQRDTAGYISLIAYTGPAVSHITIPGNVNGEAVRSIGSVDGCLFKDGKPIKRITIEKGIEEIHGSAFEGCLNLEQLDLPASTQDLEISDITVFDGCKKLRNITVASENPVYYAREGVLFNKKLNMLSYYPSGKKQKTYQVPEGIKWIGRFGSNQYLKKVILPRSATTIFGLSFSNVYNLRTIVASNNIRRLIGENQFGEDNVNRTKVKVIAYRNSYLWKQAKKKGISYSDRALKKLTAVKAERKKAGIRVSWKKNEDATGYVVYRSTSRNGEFGKAKEIKNTSRLNWLDKNVKKGQSYYYKVRAYRIVAKKKIFSKDSKMVNMKR